MRTLKRGSRGEDVKTLQTMLADYKNSGCGPTSMADAENEEGE